MQYAAAAAEAGARVVVYMFDELRGLMVDRLRDIGIDLEPVLRDGRLSLHPIDPAELAPDEFVARVRRHVKIEKASLIVIDSLNGYLNAMPHEGFLAAQLHELLSYLGQRGVLTMMVVGQQGIVGSNMRTPVDASYLADSIVLFRFFEVNGEVRKAISVTKKRGGGHENTIRELSINPQGIQVGAALASFQGVLTGVPVLLAAAASVA